MKKLLASLLSAAGMLVASPSWADAQSAFTKMRSLIGEWRAPMPRGETMTNIFRPVAFGSALLHEEWKDGEPMTVTVFHVVGSQLRADHYCDMGNQLRYVDESTDPEVLRFVLQDSSNLDTHPRHFHSTTWRYVDAAHLVQDWVLVTPGKAPVNIQMNFERVAAVKTDPASVVRSYVQANNFGNAAALGALFGPDARVFETPRDAARLTGPLSDSIGTPEQRKAFFGQPFAKRPVTRTEVMSTVTAGDLVVAKLRYANAGTPPAYGLAIYRIRDGVIQDLWHIARASTDDAAAARSGEELVAKFAAANNRGDLEAFLALFSPGAKIFRNSGDPHALGDKPSVSMVDAKTRRAAYEKMFANGAPAQVQTLGTVALNDMIVAREVATLPDGKVLDEISVYRIENGLIVHDWFIYYQAR